LRSARREPSQPDASLRRSADLQAGPYEHRAVSLLCILQHLGVAVSILAQRSSNRGATGWPVWQLRSCPSVSGLTLNRRHSRCPRRPAIHSAPRA
jgi:hypothetical protein